MNAFKLSIKLFTQGPVPPLPTFIPVFHQWIRAQNARMPVIPDHLLIDVADYAHVQNGPGIVLVSAEANIYIDENGARPGLLYVRKLPANGDFADRLKSAVATTLMAAAQLQAEPSLIGLKFNTQELQIKINDRLLAPNNAATLAETTPALDELARTLYPNQPIDIKSIGQARDVFTLNIIAPTAPTLSELIAKLTAVSPAIA